MTRKNLKHSVLYVMAIGVSIFLLFFFITCSWIGYEVKSQCQAAQRQYGGDCVEASIARLQDDHQGFRARNDAIWVLGELGDSRALSVLQSFYTGNMPDREPLDQTISQYELRKAIALTSGGANIGAVIWRGILN